MKLQWCYFWLAASVGVIDLARGDQSTSELPTVNVVGKRKPTKAQASEFSGESLEVSTRPETSVGQLLRASPSVQTRESLGEGGAPSLLIRGQDPIQNRFFLEGVPLSDGEFNAANLSWLPLETIRKVDIYPEGVPASLGEDGLGGALNFQLETPQTRERVFGLATRLGSYRFGRAFARATASQPEAEVAVDYRQSDENFSYFDDGGTPYDVSNHRWLLREHNQFRRLVVLPQLNLIRNEQQNLKLFSLNAYSRADVPGATFAPTTGNLKQWYSLSALRYEGQAGAVKLRGHLLARFDDSQLEDPSGGRLIPLHSDGKKLGAAFTAAGRGKIATWELSYGVKWEEYGVATPGGSDSRIKRRWEIPLGISAQLPLSSIDAERWVVKPALLAHGYAYSGTGGTAYGAGSLAGEGRREYLLASPRIGLSTNFLAPVQLRASLGYFYRAPAMSELYGSVNGVAPSLELVPERAWKGDVGADLDWNRPAAAIRRLRLSYSLFGARAHDLIAYTTNAQLSRVAVNIGESRVFGQELGAEVTFPIPLVFSAAGQWLFTENLTDVAYQKGKELPNRPSYSVRTGLSGRYRDFGAGYTLRLAGPAYWDVANTKRLGGVTDHAAWVSWDSGSFGTFLIEGQNLANATTAEAQFDSTTFLDNTTGYLGYPAPGRRVYLSWRCEL